MCLVGTALTSGGTVANKSLITLLQAYILFSILH